MLFELLMMGGVSPETCSAIKKHWNNKFYCTVALCWLFLYDLYHDAMIHKHQVGNYEFVIPGLTDNIKLLLIVFLRVLSQKYFFINVYTVLFLFNNVIYVFLLYDCMFMYDYPD
jgi:hypothetical protein